MDIDFIATFSQNLILDRGVACAFIQAIKQLYSLKIIHSVSVCTRGVCPGELADWGKEFQLLTINFT